MAWPVFGRLNTSSALISFAFSVSSEETVWAKRPTISGRQMNQLKRLACRQLPGVSLGI
jgi:hypothetical protein